MSLSNPIRMAILGARGIGRVHARIFKELGADVCAALGSTDESAKEAAEAINKTLGLNTRAFSNLSDLLDTALPDAVSICTPHHLHFDQTLEVLDRNIPVLCEKPLFWRDGITPERIKENLARLEAHPNRKIFVNTSSAAIAHSVIDKFDLELTDIRSFFFRIHTKGNDQGRDIGIDLMPHTFAMLMRLRGEKRISECSQKEGRHFYNCRFLYGDARVDFDFSKDSEGEKDFSFAIDGREFKRITKGSGPTYRVFFEDSLTKRMVEVEDPFVVFLRNFMDKLKGGFGPGEDGFPEASVNMRLMSDILFGGQG